MALRDETFTDLLRSLWAARLFLIVGAMIGFVLAIAIILLARPHYKISMIVAPPGNALQMDHSDADMHQNDPPNELLFQRYMQTITGPRLAGRLFEQEAEQIEKLANFRRFSFLPPQEIKSGAELSVYLERAVKFYQIGDTPLRRVEFEHPDPPLAINILEKLHTNADRLLRQASLAQSAARLAYLRETLRKSANNEHRIALGNLLMQQERAEMMARMNATFAVSVVEPPFIHPKPVWPRKSYIFPFCVLIGMMFGWVIYGLFRHEPR